MKLQLFTFLLMVFGSSFSNADSLKRLAITSVSIEIQDALRGAESQGSHVSLHYTDQTWAQQKQRLIDKGLLAQGPDGQVVSGQQFEAFKVIVVVEYTATLDQRLSAEQTAGWKNIHLPRYRQTQATNALARREIMGIMSIFPSQGSALMVQNNFTTYIAAQVLGMGSGQTFLDFVFYEKIQDSGASISLHSPEQVLELLKSGAQEHISDFDSERQELLFLSYLPHYLPHLSTDFNLVLLAELVLLNPQTFYEPFDGSTLQKSLVEVIPLIQETPQSLCVAALASNGQLVSGGRH